MEPSSEYFSRMHEQLKKDFQKYGKYVGQCAIIAAELARKFVGEKRNPFIAIFEKQGSSLVLVLYGKRLELSSHTVSGFDDMVYDPLLETPISLEEYSQKAFGESIEPRFVLKPKKGLLRRLFSC